MRSLRIRIVKIKNRSYTNAARIQALKLKCHQGAEERQQEMVRTGWIVAPGSDVARLVTLYVRKRQ